MVSQMVLWVTVTVPVGVASDDPAGAGAVDNSRAHIGAMEPLVMEMTVVGMACSAVALGPLMVSRQPATPSASSIDGTSVRGFGSCWCRFCPGLQAA